MVHKVHIPENVIETSESIALREAGFKLWHRGKVRDTYEYPGHDDWLLVVATDRLSIFDLVLPCLVRQKGEVLTALTHFWLTDVLRNFPNHLVQVVHSGHNVVHQLAAEFPAVPKLRSLVVKKLSMLNYEMIFRHHLGGSIYAEQYLSTGGVWGKEFPKDLPQWTYLEYPIFTPSTKAKVGHDVNFSPDVFFRKMGQAGKEIVHTLSQAYTWAYAFAKKRDILILDTKFECSDHGILADEVLTPDSSRFTTRRDFSEATRERRDPIFYDKQVVREWGKTVETPWGRGLGPKKLSPENPDHLAFVDGLEVPTEVLAVTSERYLEIFKRLTRTSLSEYQKSYMGFES